MLLLAGSWLWLEILACNINLNVCCAFDIYIPCDKIHWDAARGDAYTCIFSDNIGGLCTENKPDVQKQKKDVITCNREILIVS